MKQGAKTNSPDKSSSGGSGKQQSFFSSGLKVNQPNDTHEQEADRVAAQVVQKPSASPQFFTPAPKMVQREEKDKDDVNSKVLTEGATVVYDQLKENNPAFLPWKERTTERLKLKLWDNQPTEFKAGMIGFGLLNLGILGTMFGTDQRFRTNTISTLNDVDIWAPIDMLVPYSEYFGVSGFKYKLPEIAGKPYTFNTEFNLDAWFDLMSKKWNTPKISLGGGLDSEYSSQGGFNVTGGNFKVKLFGGIVKLDAQINSTLPPIPQLVVRPGEDLPPTWIMRSLPDQLEGNLPKGYGVFLSVDVWPLVDLIRGRKQQQQNDFTYRKSVEVGPVDRKANDSSTSSIDSSSSAQVGDVVSSGSGKSMDKGTRNFMEQRFNQDFSDVKIHTNSQAAESAQGINAKAYTSGKNIVFDTNQYQPNTDTGKNLLAHELVHVVQQTGTIQRKTGDGTDVVNDATVTKGIKDKLEIGNYDGALSDLNANTNGNSNPGQKKNWLLKHDDIRKMFLRALPATALIEHKSAIELTYLPPGYAFSLIDCWYQAEEEKQVIYGKNMPLFDYLLLTISPYTGVAINYIVDLLTKRITSRDYKSDYIDFDPDKNNYGNAEFHAIHLLAPTTERKFKLYKQYDKLWEAAKKKFDPFTGLTKDTMDFLTDTNDPSPKEALAMYNKMKVLPLEQRMAFMETGVFAGGLEADKDAEAYYEKNYKSQYKALPHNWDPVFMPWNWGTWDAPFAERLTIDHTYLMSAGLNYEDKATRKFGFDRGIDTQPYQRNSKTTSDATRLIEQLQDDNNFNNIDRLVLLLSIGVRAGMDAEITSKVLIPKSKEDKITQGILPIIESYGFKAAKNFEYEPDKALPADHDKWLKWYLFNRTVLRRKTGKVYGERRLTVDLYHLQETDMMRGNLGGMRFGHVKHQGDNYYNNTWIDQQINQRAGSETLLPNLEEYKGQDRTGKVYASIRPDVRQGNIYASVLPIEGLNYFSAGSLYRAGDGVLQGLSLNLSWTKDLNDPENRVNLVLGIDNFMLKHLQLVGPKSTLAIGGIAVKGLQFKIEKNQTVEALVLGMFEDITLAKDVLLTLLPGVMKMVPFAIMTMFEEFKGVKVNVYKDLLGSVMTNDFATLQAGLTFTSVSVSDMYDSMAGFLDDFSIEQRDKDNNLVRQGLVARETISWEVDAAFDIKGRISNIDKKILSLKAEAVGMKVDEEMEKLSTDKKAKENEIFGKSQKHESYVNERQELFAINRKIRDLTATIETAYKDAFGNKLNIPIDILKREKAMLEGELTYIENDYFEDKKLLEKNGGDAIKRFEARRRAQNIEAKYKSVDVQVRLRGITVKGGNYLRDLLNDLSTAAGLVSPSFEGLENINIGGVDSNFTASGKGASSLNKLPGISARDVRIPFIKAPALLLKTEKLQLQGNAPMFDDILVEARVDFVSNPLDRDPLNNFKWQITSLKIAKATFNGLQLFMGKDLPLLDFPVGVPVELWGVHLWDFDSTSKNINLSIRDVKAKGSYQDKNPAEQKNKQVDFGIDTTVDNATEQGKKDAIEIRYNNKNETLITKLNIPSAWISNMDIESPTMHLKTLPGVDAVEVKNIEAGLRVLMERPADHKDGPRPMSIEVHWLRIGEVAAQGITLQVFEEAAATDPKQKAKGRKIQEVTLPKQDKVFIRNIDVHGLRIKLDDAGPTLSTIGDDASVKLGQTDLSNIRYSEKTAKGSVLRALALHTGKFDAFTLSAVNRKGRDYTKEEFLQFFGSTRLEGLDVAASYNDGKNSGTASIKGKKNVPISIDYHEPTEEGKPGYYSMRLALSKINLPALHIVQGDHEIIIPKPADKLYTSNLSDVDVKLRAYIKFGENDKVDYDIYLDSLDVALLEVFGLEYHNKKKGIDVVFDKKSGLIIPNIKAGGFKLSSTKGFGVFGKAGGWANIAEGTSTITASFDSIKAALENGEFLASTNPKIPGPALDLDIASLGFSLDSDDNMAVTLNYIRGGLPSMTVTQTDPVTKVKTTTTLRTKNKTLAADKVVLKFNADKSKEFDVTGLSAGNLGFATIDTDKTGKKLSGTSILLPENKGVGADSVNVKLGADGSKEITFRGIYAGNLHLENITWGADGKTKIEIDLPDPDQVLIGAVHVVIDKAGNQKITIERPTIRKFKLRRASPEKKDDYVSILCDLTVDGKIEMGDGSFETLKLGAPYDAFVLAVPDSVPVEISNVKLEYKNTVEKPEEKKTETTEGLTADQQKLLDLEKPMNDALSSRDSVRQEKTMKGDSFENPEWTRRNAEYQRLKKVYDDHKANMIGAAKKQAEASSAKRYLDAVQGTVEAELMIYGASLKVNVETYNGEKYIEINDKLASQIPTLILGILRRTADAPFWKSKKMKKIGEALKFWYTGFAPGMRWVINKIADGRALEGVEDVLRKILVNVGPTIKDPNMFGLTFNIENSYTFDATSSDTFSVALCDMKYKHPTKANYFNLFGFIENFGYVSPATVSIAGEKTSAILKRLDTISADELDDLEIGEVVDLLVAFITSNLKAQGSDIGNKLVSSMYLKFSADLSVTPQTVLTELMKEKKLGTFTFDKPNPSFNDLHITGEKASWKNPEISGSIGTGPKGEGNIIVPAGKYITQDGLTKVVYESVQIAPLNMTYNDDVLKLMNKNMQITGLKVGKKKTKKP